MIIKNPLATEIGIVYKGVEYNIPAGGILENVSVELYNFWKETHSFIEIINISDETNISETTSSVDSFDHIPEEVIKENDIESNIITNDATSLS